MPTIQEQLELINGKFAQLHAEFARIDGDATALQEEKRNARNRAHAKLKARYDAITQDRENVDMFYRIARENTKTDLPLNAAPARPDIAKLNEIASQVNLYNRTDPFAARIVELAASYFAWLDVEQGKLDKEAEQLLTNDVGRIEGSEGTLAAKRSRIISQCESYLNGPEVSRLVSLFSCIDADYGINDTTFADWNSRKKMRKKMMLYGYKDFHLDAPKRFRPILKKKLGPYYNQNSGNVNCPCGFAITSYEDIFVEYNERNELAMRSGVQALIVNFMRWLPSAELKVSVFDYVRYGSAILGPLAVFSSTSGTQVDQAPNDELSMKSYAKSLCEQYKQIDQTIGSRSVHEYNTAVSEADRMPYRLLIVNRNRDAFSNSAKNDLDYLINNADKFGIFVLRLEKDRDGGSKGTDLEAKYLTNSKDSVRIICDKSGDFYIEDNIRWAPFRWLSLPSSIQGSQVEPIALSSRPKRIGTDYFKRYKRVLPARSKTNRKKISIPFAIDENDNPIECSFENENFAAYLMGAAGSGKSTLLHTIITGLMMNYHPDELELWLMDFKMTEFRKYGETKPPHVKYVLLEKSEDLVFDIVDMLTAELERRQRIFSQNHWDKLSQVPLDEHIPAIFVIIDEFAQMSQILKDTAGSGYGSDYTLKLENLLSKGRALGFKFIFASQTFTSGVGGLTETARKQVQMRFAMKNTADEIKQTLDLASHEVSESLRREISSLAPYRTLFKFRDNDGAVHVGLFDNLYIPEDKLFAIQKKLHSVFVPVSQSALDNEENSYMDKGLLCIDGSIPQSFRSQTSSYVAYERSLDQDDCDEDDVFIYPGIPCSFNVAKPFILYPGASQNILLVGGKKDEAASVILSIIQSWRRGKKPVLVCSHERAPIWRRYKDGAFARYPSAITIEEICNQTRSITESIARGKAEDKLVVLLGLDRIFGDLELAAEFADADFGVAPERPTPSETVTFEQIQECVDPQERNRLIEIFNREAEEFNSEVDVSQANDMMGAAYDARDDIKRLIKIGPSKGIHFLVVFDLPGDCISSKLSSTLFRHRLLFGMSKSDSIDILGNKNANSLEEGRFLYSDGHVESTLRPHLHPGVPLHGFELQRDGSVVRKEDRQ